MKTHLLDSSAWIECLDDGPNTRHFRAVLGKLPEVIIPVIVITEVRKVVLQQRSLTEANQVTQAMRSGKVVSIDDRIAVSAADLFIQYRLPLADSLIYAVALAHQATLWTQDHHFEGLPHVRYYPKAKS
jgi:toxin FitB